MKKTETRTEASSRPKVQRSRAAPKFIENYVTMGFTAPPQGLIFVGGATFDAGMNADTIGVVDPSTEAAPYEGEASGDLATRASDTIDALPEGGALPPVHPGEVLLEEFIRPHGLTPIRAATRMHVPRTRIERLVAGATAMTEDTALRLERLFGSSAEFWMALQLRHDLAVARASYDPSIAEIEPLNA